MQRSSVDSKEQVVPEGQSQGASILERLKTVTREIDLIVANHEYMKSHRPEWDLWAHIACCLHMADIYMRTLPSYEQTR